MRKTERKTDFMTLTAAKNYLGISTAGLRFFNLDKFISYTVEGWKYRYFRGDVEQLKERLQRMKDSGQSR